MLGMSFVKRVYKKEFSQNIILKILDNLIHQNCRLGLGSSVFWFSQRSAIVTALPLAYDDVEFTMCSLRSLQIILPVISPWYSLQVLYARPTVTLMTPGSKSMIYPITEEVHASFWSAICTNRSPPLSKLLDLWSSQAVSNIIVFLSGSFPSHHPSATLLSSPENLFLRFRGASRSDGDKLQNGRGGEYWNWSLSTCRTSKTFHSHSWSFMILLVRVI